jgi:hypothetical protein
VGEFLGRPHLPWPASATQLSISLFASAIQLDRRKKFVVRRSNRHFRKDTNPKPHLIVLDVQHLDVSAEMSANDQEPLSFLAVQYEHGVLLSKKAGHSRQGACCCGSLSRAIATHPAHQMMDVVDELNVRAPGNREKPGP